MGKTVKPLAFVDVETTGGNPLRHRIIEISIITVEDGEVVDSYTTLVDPERSIPGYISDITGISTEDVQFSPTFAGIAKTVAEKLEGCIFVAHNARFDYAFIRNELKRAGLSLSLPTLCTVRLSRALYPRQKSHSLDSLIERHELRVEERHRAYDDAMALVQFIKKAEQEKGKETVLWAMKNLLKTQTLPQHIGKNLTDDLPETPGVYIFLSSNKRPLYIGKSVNIRKRVLSHFSSDHSDSKELSMKNRIASIEYIETKGELSALILESTLIKEKMPLYNRKLRRKHSQCVLMRKKGINGYHTMEAVYGSHIEPTDLADAFGVFASKQSALYGVELLCNEYQLCPAVLGLEKWVKGKACFSYHLKRCNGACMKEISARKHNTLLKKALSSMHHGSWMFPGPVGIKEYMEDGEVMHIVDNWTYLGEAVNDEDVKDILEKGRLRNFEFDTYKILRSFLRTKKERAEVVQLGCRL